MKKHNLKNIKNPIVLFDTNFLLLPEQFKVDIFEKTKKLLLNPNIIFCVFDKTIDELKKISTKNSKHSVAAKIGIQLILKMKNEKNILIIDSNNDTSYVDKLILNYNDYIDVEDLSNFYIATQDKMLKLELKNKKFDNNNVKINNNMNINNTNNNKLKNNKILKIIVLAQKNILKIF